MASKIGMAVRQEQAQRRIDAAVTALSAASGLEIAPLPATHRADPVLRATRRDEWIADTLEAVTAHVAAAAKDEPTDGQEEADESAPEAHQQGDEPKAGRRVRQADRQAAEEERG